VRVAAAQILPGEPPPVVMAALNADPAHRITGADAFRGWIQELADRAIAELDQGSRPGGTRAPPSIKAFHRRALDLGPMGLDLLRAELAGDRDT
jgi:uncharacterized protein (DUF885 family)